VKRWKYCSGLITFFAALIYVLIYRAKIFNEDGTVLHTAILSTMFDSLKVLLNVGSTYLSMTTRLKNAVAHHQNKVNVVKIVSQNFTIGVTK
jgi:hypothetical protein